MRKWNKNDLKETVKNSKSLREVMIKLGLRPAGGNYQTLKNTIKSLNLETSHFLGKGWAKGRKHSNKRMVLEEVLIKGKLTHSHRLKTRLIKANIKKAVCEHCKNSTWQDHPIPLELNHINGDRFDNRLINIEIICPNCHALTPNYRAKNIRPYDEKVDMLHLK